MGSRESQEGLQLHFSFRASTPRPATTYHSTIKSPRTCNTISCITMTPPSSTPSLTYVYPQQCSSLASLTPLSLSSVAPLTSMSVVLYHAFQSWRNFHQMFEDATSSDDENQRKALTNFCRYCKEHHDKRDFVYSDKQKRFVKNLRTTCAFTSRT